MTQVVRWLLLSTLFLTFSTTAFALVDQSVLALQENISGSIAKIRPSVISVRAEKQMNNGMWFQSIGAGFVVDVRGYIVTNYHVVNEGRNIQVSLWRSGQKTFPATLIDVDKALDLALLKVDTAEAFLPASLGNSERIERGDYVLCIGSPFGFNHSVSLGIVSDLNRQLMIGTTQYKDMIQTDAVINEGNSGGPMVDVNGQVVGIATAIYAPDGTYTGLGFAIPINRAKHFISRHTGALLSTPLFTIAATQPLPAAAKEPIDMNMPLPGDAIHQQFSDCTQCHTITTKMVASYQAELPTRRWHLVANVTS